MLALAHARRWPRAGYRLPDHPVQREMLNEVAQATGLAPSRIATAVDGCGVVTFALPLSRMAGAFARLQSLEAGDRVATAMRTHPELIRGPGAADTLLMQTLAGWVAKAGAEGLLCAVAPDGLAVALKVADGNGRAVKPALAALVERLGYALPEFARVPVTNSRGEAVGELVCPGV